VGSLEQAIEAVIQQRVAAAIAKVVAALTAVAKK
jgi:hypothetical protein